MTFTDWLCAVELKLGANFDGDATIKALNHYREGWTVDEYATEVYYQLLEGDIEEVA